MIEKETLVITFNESLADSSIRQIKRILSESLGYETEIERENDYMLRRLSE